MKTTANFFNYSLERCSNEDALEWAKLVDWTEIETSPQTVSNLNFIDTVNGIDIFYCYGTDTYLFAENN